MTDLAHRVARMFARHIAEQAGLPITDSWLDDEAGRWLAVARQMLDMAEPIIRNEVMADVQTHFRLVEREGPIVWGPTAASTPPVGPEQDDGKGPKGGDW